MTPPKTAHTAPATPAAPAASTAPNRPRALVVVLAGNMLIDALEVSSMVVALPSISAGLHLSPAAAQWVLSGFAAGFGGLLLFGGRLVDLFGRRRVYLAGLLGFAAASVLAALAGAGPLLVGARFVKGFCVGLTAPTGMAIIATAFKEPAERTQALSVYTLFGAGGFTVGLVLSGLLTEVSWRWTMLFPAPVVLVLFAFAARLIPRGPGDTAAAGERRLELPAALCSSGTLLALIGAVSLVPAHGWGSRPVDALLALSAALLSGFVLLQRGSPRPLVRGAVLADAPLIRSALGAAALNGSYLSLLFVATFELQSRPGWTALRTALALTPASVPLAATALSSGRMIRRFGPPRLILAGSLAALAGYALYPHGRAPVSYAADVLPTLLLVGLGFVLAFAALNAQAVSGAPAALRAEAGGLFQTAVQSGGAISLALVAALCGRGARPSYGPALWFVTAVGAAGSLVALTAVLRRRPAVAVPGPPRRRSTR